MLKSRNSRLSLRLNRGVLRPILGVCFSWIAIGYFRDYVHRNFRVVENEYYNHQVAAANKINFECHFNVRLAYILLALIRHFKDIPKIIKFMKKGKKVYGASNI